MSRGVLNLFPGRRSELQKPADFEVRHQAEAYFRRLAEEGLSDKEVFARILQDPNAFEHAVAVRKLHELIPELNAFEENLPDQDPNIYRPMPLMQHMFESIRQTFTWTHGFGAEEYEGDDAKRNALLWINAALLFHDQGEIALLKGTDLPLWYHFAVEWSKKRIKNIIRETYPFFGMDTPEGRSYIDHLRHPDISAVLAAGPLLRLGWEPRAVKVVQFLIRNHSALIEKATYGRLKDGRVLHEDLFMDIASVADVTGVARNDLLKMLQVVQIMDAKAVKTGMAQVPQETMMRVWMAYSYMNVVLTIGSSTPRYRNFKNYHKLFVQIRRGMPFGTPFEKSFGELLRCIEEKDCRLNEHDRKLLEQELEYFDRFEVIREDHIHINNQFNQLLHLLERKTDRELPAKDKAVLLQAYKIAYRSHDGQFRRAFKIVPTGDKRRKYIEHPIKVAKIMVRMFGVTDPLPLATVMFHDVLEDTDINVDDILAAFKNDDEKGRIIQALSLLTKPESRKSLKGNWRKDLAYFVYIAGILTAGDKVLDDRELFEWLRFILPRTKAADKIHNRRSLMARKPEGRIKEICRNENTLRMFMEASNLTPEEKLRLLEDFDKSLFELFIPLNFKLDQNAKKFQEALHAFRRFARTLLGDVEATRPKIQALIQKFDDGLRMLPQCLEEPHTILERLKMLEKTLPFFCREIGLDDRRTAALLDEFAFFLFGITEVDWLTDESRRRIIRFQSVVRRYKEKLKSGRWEPKLAGAIDALARYVQGYPDAPPPSVRFGVLPDIAELLSRVPGIHRWYDKPLARKKRKLVARLLPRLAMLPLRHIYWLEGNEIKSVDSASIERELGGLSLEKRFGRIILKIHRPLARFCLNRISRVID